MALFGPAWQASVNEQVPPKLLPAAIALNSISFNIARSFGPAIGGVIVAAAGSVAAFAANAVLYLPLLVVLFSGGATRSRRGCRRSGWAGRSSRACDTSSIRRRCARCCCAGADRRARRCALRADAAGGPRPARRRRADLRLDAGRLRYRRDLRRVLRRQHAAKFGSEGAVRAALLAMGIGTAVVALSRMPALTALAFASPAAAGCCRSRCSTSRPDHAPRWVSGRAVAAFRSVAIRRACARQLGLGLLAVHIGIEKALLVSAIALLVSPLIGDLAADAGGRRVSEDWRGRWPIPEVRLALDPRSGPIVVEIEYRIDQSNAREFYDMMQQVQLNRQRNGAYGWSIARDIADPGVVDRALSLPDLARLSAPAHPADRRRAGAATRRRPICTWPRAGPHPPHAGAAVRLGALEGGYARRGKRRR